MTMRSVYAQRVRSTYPSDAAYERAVIGMIDQDAAFEKANYEKLADNVSMTANIDKIRDKYLRLRRLHTGAETEEERNRASEELLKPIFVSYGKLHTRLYLMETRLNTINAVRNHFAAKPGSLLEYLNRETEEDFDNAENRIIDADWANAYLRTLYLCVNRGYDPRGYKERMEKKRLRYGSTGDFDAYMESSNLYRLDTANTELYLSGEEHDRDIV